MAVIGRWSKSPDEQRRYGVDYSNWLNAGERLTDVECFVSPRTSPEFTAPGVVITDNAYGVVFFVNGGVAGTTYKLVIRATTTAGQVKEDTVLYSVREP